MGGVEVPVMGEMNEKESTKEEVERALKAGKAPGVDSIRPEMMKEGGASAVEWLVRMFNVCFISSMVSVDWMCA